MGQNGDLSEVGVNNKNTFETTTRFFIRKDVVHHPVEIPIHRLSGSKKVPENQQKKTEGFLSASPVENPPKKNCHLFMRMSVAKEVGVHGLEYGLDQNWNPELVY